MPPMRLLQPIARLALPAATAALIGAGVAALWLGWPPWLAAAAGLLALGLAVCWRRETELRERRIVMGLLPCAVEVLDARRRPAWEAGALRLTPPPSGALPLEARLKHALWHKPAAEREAVINDQLAAALRGDGRAEMREDAEGRPIETRHLALPGGRIAALSRELSAVPLQPAAEADVCALFAHAPIGIWLLDGQGRTRFANERLLRLFGGARPESLAASGMTRLGAEGGDGLLSLPPGEECEALLRTGEGRELRLLVAAWPDGGSGLIGAGRLLSVQDVTALRAAQARLEHLSEHDPLTGLANRASFQAGLAAMAASPRGGLVMLVNLDHFKAANERFGHAMGDALLREAAARLREAVRPSDLVARLGADEFAILAFDAGRETALALAGRVRAAMRGVVRIAGVELSISASIGIAAAPEHGEEPESLLRAADLAMREAKAMGRNTVCLFEPALRERSEQRAILREAFAEALERGELELHVQPQRDLERQLVTGAEALVRWNSRRLGRWVSPGEMLPAASEGGLLGRLDRFVLERAVALLAEWQDEPGAPAQLAINVSVTTLQDPLFPREVREVLSRAGVPADRLEIEIPEDLAIRDLPGVQRTLHALREEGVLLALDDFGGGHSGLPHVVRLPVQRLKLDRSIVAGLPDDPKAYAVLRATVALARGMGIEVVGEGVETEAQAFALRRAGCRVVQGWLVAKPMPPEALVPRRRQLGRHATA